ncbi:hypothetical protein [Clostridium beijerinckii]|uniref:Uncharacterized protein n=1 Tax=Clostridium beijerinckii TaxID=1520 RepID=A0AAX0B813_CLOBE|nr:hypothetical protein [Clostridium beijerinckii]NRT91271.1 hypothetical protein [Clostridium beijerinckii]NYC70797.1 hypothetical protein [Clostridium beijerinckii]
MIIKADKEKILKEFHEKYVLNRYKDEFTKIIEKYKTSREKIKENLTSKFNSVCKEAISLQEKELKGEIRYIYFSMLRTKILENKGEWRIDLYDEKWFLDKEECSINIDLEFIYESLFNHMKELLEKKKEYGRIIKERDIEAMKLKEANKYHILAANVVIQMLQSFFECTSYNEMKKKEDLKIMVGEYMEASVMIYSQ